MSDGYERFPYLSRLEMKQTEAKDITEEVERLKAENAALKDQLQTAYFDSFQPVRWMRP